MAYINNPDKLEETQKAQNMMHKHYDELYI